MLWGAGPGPKLSEKCRFVEPHLPIKRGNPYISPYMRPTLNGIDYNQLPLALRSVFAFTDSFELHSDYANSSVRRPQLFNVVLVINIIEYLVILTPDSLLVLLMEYLLNCYLHRILYLKEVTNLYYVWILLQIPLPLTRLRRRRQSMIVLEL